MIANVINPLIQIFFMGLTVSASLHVCKSFSKIYIPPGRVDSKSKGVGLHGGCGDANVRT
jgi:hypothetical protein